MLLLSYTNHISKFGDLVKVRRKKGSVFNRLTPPQKSLADDLVKVSFSVYISNFPSHLTVRELWNICGKKGTLADVFIAKHKNKMGQSFGFCQFIKVNNPDDLVSSLNSIRIGKLWLHAKMARDDRSVVGKSSQAKISPVVKKGHKYNHDFSARSDSYANVTKNLMAPLSRILGTMVYLSLLML